MYDVLTKQYQNYIDHISCHINYEDMLKCPNVWEVLIAHIILLC